MERKKLSRAGLISIIAVVLLIPLVLIAADHFGNRKYYLTSVVIMILAMIPFFAEFEGRKPHARELVTIAVMCAIAVISRAAFIMLPAFKPLVGIVIITGIAFGPSAGFLTGAMSGFVSNFIFGQGPYTPWQMFAFGIAGFICGFLAQKNIIVREKPLRTAIIGASLIMLVVGPILDTCALFTMASMIDISSVSAVYISGIPYNAVHAAATFLTLLLIERPMLEKLDRIKIKYGMMSGEDDEI